MKYYIFSPFRSGFDGNHVGIKSIEKCHHGHFGPETVFNPTDEQGQLLPDCMFGTNHLCLITNDPRYGNLSHGLHGKGEEDGSVSPLPLSVNGGDGSSAAILLCSGWEPGADEAKFVTGFYLVRVGHINEKLEAKFVKGEDKWKFGYNDEAVVTVEGVRRSVYGFYHNRDNVLSDISTVKGQAMSHQCQTIKGEEETIIMSSVNNQRGVLLVMCSNSSGTVNATAAAVYMLTLCDGSVKSECVSDDHGDTYREAKSDLWTFQILNNTLIVSGPSGPCRYGFISNLFNDGSQSGSTTAPACLATGQPEPIRGAVSVTDKGLTGQMSKRAPVLVKRNEEATFVFEAGDLVETDGGYAFHREWTKEEQAVGLHLIRVYAVCKHATGHCHLMLFECNNYFFHVFKNFTNLTLRLTF